MIKQKISKLAESYRSLSKTRKWLLTMIGSVIVLAFVGFAFAKFYFHDPSQDESYACPEAIYRIGEARYAESAGERWQISPDESYLIEQNCQHLAWSAEDEKDPEEEKTDDDTSEDEELKDEAAESTTNASKQSAEDSAEEVMEESGSEEQPSESTPPPDEEQQQESDVDTTPPLIKHLGVSFAPYNEETGRAGAFYFAPLDRNPFIGFADVVSSPSGPKALPTFEYYVASGSTVYAISDAYIQRITYQADTSDYEIETSKDRDGNNQYRVWYDHVKNLSISEGQKITAGQSIGTVGTWSGSLGRTEIMITGNNLAYCPFYLYDSGLSSSHQQLVANLISDWEAFKGDSGLYNESLYPTYMGCRQNTMVE